MDISVTPLIWRALIGSGSCLVHACFHGFSESRLKCFICFCCCDGHEVHAHDTMPANNIRPAVENGRGQYTSIVKAFAPMTRRIHLPSAMAARLLRSTGFFDKLGLTYAYENWRTWRCTVCPDPVSVVFQQARGNVSFVSSGSGKTASPADTIETKRAVFERRLKQSGIRVSVLAPRRG